MVGLSKSQKLVYDMEKYAGGRIATICGSLLIEGSRDETLLKKAVNDLYRLNSALRTRICEGSEGTVQEEAPYSERDIAVVQFNSKDELDKYAVEYVKVPISIYGNLCEINVILLPGRFGFLVKLHHIIADAWSLTLLCSQFISLLKGETPRAFSYLEHLNSEERYIYSEMYVADKNYFLSEYKKCDDITLLSENRTILFLLSEKPSSLTVVRRRVSNNMRLKPARLPIRSS